MGLFIKNVKMLNGEQLEETNIRVKNGRIEEIGAHLNGQGETEIDGKGRMIAPGFVDVHVHLREPGERKRKPLKAARNQRRAAAIRPSAPCRIHGRYRTRKKISITSTA